MLFKFFSAPLTTLAPPTARPDAPGVWPNVQPDVWPDVRPDVRPDAWPDVRLDQSAQYNLLDPVINCKVCFLVAAPKLYKSSKKQFLRPKKTKKHVMFAVSENVRTSSNRFWQSFALIGALFDRETAVRNFENGFVRSFSKGSLA